MLVGGAGGQRLERAPHEGAGELDLVRRAGERRGRLELALQEPRDRRDARERDPRRPAPPRGRDADERKRVPPAASRLQVDGRVRGRDVELEDDLARLERGRAPVVLGRNAVERADRQLAAVGAERRPEGEQRPAAPATLPRF